MRAAPSWSTWSRAARCHKGVRPFCDIDRTCTTVGVSPMSQKGLLKYAMNTEKIDNAKIGDGGDSDSGDERDITGFKSKKESK